MQHTVIVVGGGPAGMAAALTAAESGARVTLLERRPTLGKKLLATGNGRCNLANRGDPAYFGDPVFADRVLSVCPTAAVLRRLGRWGLRLYTDPEGRVYPATLQASTVLSLLAARLREAGVSIRTGTDITRIDQGPHDWTVTDAQGACLRAERLILATGGLAGGALGNRRSDYALSERLGHRVTPLFAGLAPLEVTLGPLKRLSGLRLPARVSLYTGSQLRACAAGEVLLTDYGLSGICVMQLARDANALLAAGKPAQVALDLSPVFFPETRAWRRLPPVPADSYARTLTLLVDRARRFSQPLTGLVPDALIPHCPAESPERLARFLTELRLPVTGVRPMAQAQITCGGIDTAQVAPDTLSSTLFPGLLFAGETLNVDGDCGGYNLQFAFATGLIAGHAAAS